MTTSAPRPLLTLTLHDHLVELRRRLLLSLGLLALLTGLLYTQADTLFNWLTWPLVRALGPEAGQHRFIFTDLPEAFFTHVQVGFFGACMVGLPVVLHQVWGFVGPGLYPGEKASLRSYLWASPLLFYAGVALAYGLILPLAWCFFLSFELPRSAYLPVVLEPKMGDYVDLVIKVSLGFGLCFQLPILLLFLGRLGLLKAQQLRQKRRYAIILIFVVAAVATPPDVFSQVALAVPLMALYEITLWLMGRQEKRQR